MEAGCGVVAVPLLKACLDDMVGGDILKSRQTPHRCGFHWNPIKRENYVNNSSISSKWSQFLIKINVQLFTLLTLSYGWLPSTLYEILGHRQERVDATQISLNFNLYPARCPHRPHGLMSSDEPDKNLERLHMKIIFFILQSYLRGLVLFFTFSFIWLKGQILHFSCQAKIIAN